MEISLRAYAKINLGLRVLRQRGDGYHDVETIFHRIDCYDEISLSLSPAVSMTCSDPDLPTGEQNLCVKAANTLRNWCGTEMGVHISLTKRIPVGAGLGGGSSDAAAILRGLRHLWGITIPHRDLLTVASALGSDVPYFLQNGSAYAQGRGEILDYFLLDLPYWIIVAFPNIHISTEWAYRNIHPRERKDEMSLKALILRHKGNVQPLNEHLANDFESLVTESHEIVGRIIQDLRDGGADLARMSGSGSSVFGFFPEEKLARTAAERLGSISRIIITPPHFQSPVE